MSCHLSNLKQFILCLHCAMPRIAIADIWDIRYMRLLCGAMVVGFGGCVGQDIWVGQYQWL